MVGGWGGLLHNSLLIVAARKREKGKGERKADLRAEEGTGGFADWGLFSWGRIIKTLLQDLEG